MAIVSLASLPYLHEIITTRDIGLRDWVPNIGIEQFLTDGQGKVLGFSSYRMFLFTFLIFTFSGFGWLAWLLVSKQKKYYYATFIPVLMGAYHIFIILLDFRKAKLNSLEVKLFIMLGISLVMFFAHLKKHRFKRRTLFIWLGFMAISVLPYFHDIITLRDTSLRGWVPIIGLENLLSNGQSTLGGFGSYRAFIYFLTLHIYAHLGWLGAFIYYDAKKRKPRPFLLVPIIISLYTIIIILLNWQETGFNKPDVKFYITIVLSILLALNFFFNDKVKNKISEKA